MGNDKRPLMVLQVGAKVGDPFSSEPKHTTPEYVAKVCGLGVFDEPFTISINALKPYRVVEHDMSPAERLAKMIEKAIDESGKELHTYDAYRRDVAAASDRSAGARVVVRHVREALKKAGF
jgi:hypothetical protein